MSSEAISVKCPIQWQRQVRVQGHDHKHDAFLSVVKDVHLGQHPVDMCIEYGSSCSTSIKDVWQLQTGQRPTSVSGKGDSWRSQPPHIDTPDFARGKLDFARSTADFAKALQTLLEAQQTLLEAHQTLLRHCRLR